MLDLCGPRRAICGRGRAPAQRSHGFLRATWCLPLPSRGPPAHANHNVWIYAIAQPRLGAQRVHGHEGARGGAAPSSLLRWHATPLISPLGVAVFRRSSHGGGRPPAPTTAFGYAYRTTALGAQRVHGQGARCRGPPMLWLACSTRPALWLRGRFSGRMVALIREGDDNERT